MADRNRQYCSTNFPIGCYIDKEGMPKDACSLINYQYQKADTYFFTDWGQENTDSGRIICK